MPDSSKTPHYVDLNRPAIFAHRGSSMHAPENTLAAFRLAIEQQADGIELDVKLTRDNHVVVMHDDTVDRTTDGTGRVKSLTLQELKQFDAGARFDAKYTGERIPTLEEVLETCGRKIFINLELTNYTSPTDDLAERVATIITNFNLVNNILLSSYNLLALIRARHQLPGIHVGLLTYPKLANINLRSPLLRFGPLFALHPAEEDINQDLIQVAHKKHARVHAYTVNQPEIMQRLFSMGTDGIFTDDPLLAQKVLTESKSSNL